MLFSGGRWSAIFRPSGGRSPALGLCFPPAVNSYSGWSPKAAQGFPPWESPFCVRPDTLARGLGYRKRAFYLPRPDKPPWGRSSRLSPTAPWSPDFPKNAPKPIEKSLCDKIFFSNLCFASVGHKGAFSKGGARGRSPLDLKAMAGGVGGGLERPDAHR